ncbi:HU family DNA-binding protein [Candidatus Uhrbacteria bacterium]|nr:HU family DNA-binding protein [Candidatus Uhrbacteria bacterium]
MNKSELAQKLSEKVNLSKAKLEEVLEAFTDEVTATVRGGGEVNLAGFGAFSAKARKGRSGVNPRNLQQRIEIPPMRTPKFKAGKNLKEALKS